MDLADQLALSDLNLVESMREFTRRVPGGVVHEADGILLFKGHDALLSGVIRTDAQPARAGTTTMSVAETFFRGFGHGYSVLTRPRLDADLERAAEEVAFTLARDQPGMVLEHSVDKLPLPRNAELRRIDDLRGRMDFAEIQTEVVPDWADSVRGIFCDDCSLLATPHAAAFVIYVDGIPASAAMVSVIGCVGGVDWVATKQRFRGQRLGEAVTRVASNAGFALGARLIGLQANPQAEPMYVRAGYRTIVRYRWYERAVDLGVVPGDVERRAKRASYVSVPGG